MKKILFVLIAVLALGGSAQAQKAKGKKAKKEAKTAWTFDFNKYKDAMLANACPRFAKSDADVRFVEYALLDIDEDGQPEVWVRGDEGQDYQGVFAIDGDTIVLLADADVCSELHFCKNTVGFHCYISPGRVYEGYSVLKNSRIVSSCNKEMEFNIFSDNQETTYESYVVNDKEVDEDGYNAFVNSLGDEYKPQPVWITIQ